MNILIINGSPKGENSITLQTANYIMQRFPQHHYETLHASARIASLEKDFTPAREAMERADMIIFCYPVYTFIAPSQLHRFIELMKASGTNLRGRIATQITTSKHFYDVTAHRYIEQNAFDMGMNVIHGLSADMDDLLSEQGRADGEAFFRYALFSAEKGLFERTPAPQETFVSAPVSEVMPREKQAGDVVIVTDVRAEDHSLNDMIKRFRAALPMQSRLVNIREYPFKGGCLGCFHCAASGKCVYQDGFDTFLREDIQRADAIVYAFSIQDHAMGAVMKRYDDRQFCNGHRTVTQGMPVGYLVSGPYSREENLHMIVEGRAEVGGNFLAGVATDEFDPDAQIDMLAARLTYALNNHYTQPANFLGVGGRKIFRDLIYLMRGMMKADHHFYKKHGHYDDFPQKHKMTIIKMYLVGMLISSPKLMARAGNKMTEGMLAPYKKVLKKKG